MHVTYVQPCKPRSNRSCSPLSVQGELKKRSDGDKSDKTVKVRFKTFGHQRLIKVFAERPCTVFATCLCADAHTVVH